MSDFERVKAALQMVRKHRANIIPYLSDTAWDIIAETAVKTMYLIDAGNDQKNKSASQMSNEEYQKADEWIWNNTPKVK